MRDRIIASVVAVSLALWSLVPPACRAADDDPAVDWFSLALADPETEARPHSHEYLNSEPTVGTASASDSSGSYVPWRDRRGPAYRDDVLRSIGRDLYEMPEVLWEDTKATFTDPVVLVGLAAAGAAGIALNAGGADDCIAEKTESGPVLNSFWDSVGDVGGSPAFHFPLAGVMYLAGYYTEDDKLFETSKTLGSALIINGLTTLALKGICRTDAPNGDGFGWPSGHTSSSFALATVMYKAYGPWVGVPLYAFAGYVGWERIDARNHDFSDVISGMIIGTVIGYAVANNHEQKIFGMDVMPYFDPSTGTTGVALSKRW